MRILTFLGGVAVGVIGYHFITNIGNHGKPTRNNEGIPPNAKLLQTVDNGDGTSTLVYEGGYTIKAINPDKPKSKQQ